MEPLLFRNGNHKIKKFNSIIDKMQWHEFQWSHFFSEMEITR